MLVTAYMTTHPTTISLSDNLRSADEKMRAGGFRRLPVVEGDRLVGILCDRDLRAHVGHWDDTRVNGAMTEKLFTVTPTTTLEEAAERMLGLKIDSVPVVEDGKLVGIVTTSDVIRAFLKLSTSPAEPRC